MLYPRFNELVALKQKTLSLLLPSSRSVTSIDAGDHLSLFRGQGLNFEEVRAYAPGDDIRSIDWRVTARTGSPHTKVFREERERSVILVVDVNVAMRFGTKGTFKSIQAAKVAAMLGWQACLSHHKLGAYLFGDVPDGIQYFKPYRSTKPLLAMFKKLSRTDINENALLVSLEETLGYVNKAVSTGALVYVISDFNTVTTALEYQLSSLRKRCDVILIPIDDPADKLIPALGPVFFSMHPQDKVYINTDDQVGRERYTAQWIEIRKSLQQIASKLKMGMIPISTNEDPYIKLSCGLKQIQQVKRKK